MTETMYYLGVCVSGGRGWGFLDISTAECVVETFTLHSYKGQVGTLKHIHNMTTIFYLYDCISFNDLPESKQTDEPY